MVLCNGMRIVATCYWDSAGRQKLRKGRPYLRPRTILLEWMITQNDYKNREKSTTLKEIALSYMNLSAVYLSTKVSLLEFHCFNEILTIQQPSIRSICSNNRLHCLTQYKGNQNSNVKLPTFKHLHFYCQVRKKRVQSE